MGKRTHSATRFIVRSGGNSLRGLVQFVANTGRSIYKGARDGLDDIEGIELYETPKPQATRKKK